MKILKTILLFLFTIKFCMAQSVDTTKYGVFKIEKPHRAIIASDTIYDYSKKNKYSKQRYPKCYCSYVDFYLDEEGKVKNPTLYKSWGKKYDKLMLDKVQSKTAFGMNNLKAGNTYTVEVCIETY